MFYIYYIKLDLTSFLNIKYTPCFMAKYYFYSIP